MKPVNIRRDFRLTASQIAINWLEAYVMLVGGVGYESILILFEGLYSWDLHVDYGDSSQ